MPALRLNTGWNEIGAAAVAVSAVPVAIGLSALVPASAAGAAALPKAQQAIAEAQPRYYVIGQNAGTTRVKDIATSIGADYFEVDTTLSRADRMRMNLQWVYDHWAAGDVAVDAGPIAGAGQSVPNNAETALLDALNAYGRWMSFVP